MNGNKPLTLYLPEEFGKGQRFGKGNDAIRWFNKSKIGVVVEHQ